MINQKVKYTYTILLRTQRALVLPAVALAMGLQVLAKGQNIHTATSQAASADLPV